MPRITKQIREQIVRAIRNEASIHQPCPGELDRALDSLNESFPNQLWHRLRGDVIRELPDGSAPSNLGATLSSAIFLDVTVGQQHLDSGRLATCLFRLARGDSQERGIDWLHGMEGELELTDQGARDAHPALSSNAAAVELRRLLLGVRRVGIPDAADAVSKLCRAVLLGDDWGDGAGDLAEYLKRAAITDDGRINVDGLSRAHDFIDRLRLHWGGAGHQAQRLEAVARQIRNRLMDAAIPASGAGPEARLQLQRISVMQVVERIAPRLASEGHPHPWTEDDQRSIADPYGGSASGFRLVSLFRVVSASDGTVLDDTFKQRLHWTLCLREMGLEGNHRTGHRLEHYPRATAPHEDERGALSRLRFLVRVAIGPDGIDGMQQFLGEALTSADAIRRAADATLHVLSQPRQDREGAQMVIAALQHPEDRLNLAKRLVSLEIDTWSAHHSDTDSVSLIQTILSYVPRGERGGVLHAELAAEGLLRAKHAPNRAKFFQRTLACRQSPRFERIVLQGRDAFRTWVASSYHREFSETALLELRGQVRGLGQEQDGASWHHFDAAVEELAQFGAVGEHPHQERGFFGAYGSAADLSRAVLSPGPERLGGVLGLPRFHALALEAWDSPLAREELFGQAQSLQEAAAPQALRDLWQNPNGEYDALGRSRAFMIAFVADPRLTEAVLNNNRVLLHHPHQASRGGVTPLMMAARRAGNGMESARGSLGHWIASPGPGGIDARDGRGWRAIHHALALGNTEAAKMLVSGGAKLDCLDGDGTTVLLAAMHAGGENFGKSVRWVLENLEPAQLGAMVPFESPHDAGARDATGGRTNVLAAAFRKPFWEAKPVLELLSSHAQGVWNAARVAGDNGQQVVDPALEDCVVEIMQAHAGLVIPVYRSNEHFRALVNGNSCAPRVCRKLIDELTAENIRSVADKFSAMIAAGVPVLQYHDAVVGNVLHQLVGRLRQLRADGQAPREIEVHYLVSEMLRAAGTHEALNRPLGHGGSDPIVRAVRSGLPLVALLYSQALQGQGDDARLAATFLEEPRRYQSDVDPQFQFERTGGVAVLHCGGERRIDLGRMAGQGEMRVEAPYKQQQCLDFIKRARLDIQQNLNAELIPAGPDGIDGRKVVAIDASALERCWAHLVRRAH